MAAERYRFSDIFQENPDGSLSPRIKVNINGVVLNQGLSIGRGVAFGGVDFHIYKNLDVAGEYIDDTLQITGFFK